MSLKRKSRPFREWMGGNDWRTYPACQSFNNTPFFASGLKTKPVFPAWIWFASKIWNWQFKKRCTESFQICFSPSSPHFSTQTGPDMASTPCLLGQLLRWSGLSAGSLVRLDFRWSGECCVLNQGEVEIEGMTMVLVLVLVLVIHADIMLLMSHVQCHIYIHK